MKDFLRVLREERVGWRKVVGMLWTLRSGVVGWRRSRERMEVCRKCPIYNREMRQCRPFPGHGLGCGCYVPMLVWVRKPYPSGCWGRSYVKVEGIGWE